MKKLVSLLAGAVLAVELLAVPAFAAKDESQTEPNDITMHEAQAMFLEYLEGEGIELQLGTPEYYEYISRQLLERTDADLLSDPNYDIIHVYMAGYKAMYEDFVLNFEQTAESALDETNCLKWQREQLLWHLFAAEGRAAHAADELSEWLSSTVEQIAQRSAARFSFLQKY